MPGILYIVATPIGNLEDMTLRGVRTLGEADVIAAEDTRHTQILLNHFGIRTPVTSYHEHNEKTKARQLMDRLERGQSVALVSDAGTPAISDPGYRLIVAAIAAGIRVTPVPGVSAVTAVLSASGLPTDRFVFEGFLPAKKNDRRARLQSLSADTRTLVFYEAPHRLKESLEDLCEILGDREAVLAREVSKIHEEFWRGRLADAAREASERNIIGEITLVIKGSSGEPKITEDRLKTEIIELRKKAMRVKEIADYLGEKYRYPKKAIYRLAIEQK
ncbi:MAG TPA: 16S rRNA (cytidine(1402)-2'-O)-methyltransferase [Candidatus Binatia bacterium]|nr:16S rRNA (cytidine(1402)-2'-O)-methyltransferase [Candidatus Binatia bacterium]